MKKGVFYLVIFNMASTAILCVSGTYLLAPTMKHFTSNGNISHCGYYTTSMLANLTVMILISVVGLVLSAFALILIGTKFCTTCTLIPFFFVKSVEIGGLIFCESCIVILSYTKVVKNVNSVDEWCFTIPPFILAVVIALKILTDICVIVLVIKLDEELRKQWWIISNKDKNTPKQNELIALISVGTKEAQDNIL